MTYSLSRSTDSNHLGDLASDNSPDNYFVDTGLVPSTTYYYTLVALTKYGSNDNRPSAQATTFSSTPICADRPSSPSGFTAKADSSSQISLSWGSVIPPLGCSVSYTLYRDTSSGFSPSPANQVAAQITMTIFADTGLAPSTTYYYIVRAADEIDLSDNSNRVNATTSSNIPTCTAAPSAPTGVEAIASSSSQINLTWGAVALPSGCTVTYSVYRSKTSDVSPSSVNPLVTELPATSFSDSGLTPATTYYYIVTASDAAGSSGNSGPVSATTFSNATCAAGPSAPTGFTATASSSSQINLSWNAVTPPPACSVTYALFRDVNSNFTPGWGNLIAAQLSNTSYSDVGLAPSTTYYYLMQAVDSAGISGNSAQVNATTQQGPDSCMAAPSAASELTATALSPTRIDVSWKAVVPPPGCSVTYAVFRSLNIDFSSPTQLAGGLTSTSFSSTGLSPSTVYYFGVRTSDSKGYADATAASATTPGTESCLAAPTAPAGVTATAKSPSQIDLTWNTVAPPSGCPAVTYAVYQSTTNSFTPSDANRVAMNLSSAGYSSTGLTASTTYYFVVRAVDAAGSSPSSSQASAATSADSACATAPSAPIGLTATAVSPSQINLSWGSVTPPTGCSALTYAVYQSTDSSFAPSDANRVAANLPSPSYSSTGLTASTTYYFIVRAVDVAGSSPDSNKTSAATSADSACATAPSAPTGLTATAKSSSQVDLSWGSVTPPTGCSALTYAVYQSTSSSFAPSDANRVAANLPSPSYSSTGLTASTTYYFVVRAVDAAGSSPSSSQASAATSADSACATAPSAPTGLTTTAKSSSQVDLSWGSVTPPTGCSALTYAVYQSTDSSFAPSDANRVAANLPSPSYSSTGLTASTTYYFIVRAVDVAGSSPDSNKTSAATSADSACATAPSAPTGLTATAKSSSQVDLSWGSVTPPTGCSVTYAVYQGTSNSFSPADSNRVANNLPSPSYSATGLSPATTYYFMVRAVDAAGSSPNSAQASATTQSASTGGRSAVGSPGDAAFSLLALASLAIRARHRTARRHGFGR